jgi:hypothetical protein
MARLSTLRGQRGITMIGFITVLVVGGFFAYMAMVLGPAYSEYYGVVKAMKSVSGEPSADSQSIDELRKALQRHFDVGYVDSVEGKDAKIVRDRNGKQLVMKYEVRKHFVYNIDFTVMFEYAVVLDKNSAGE